MCGHSRLAAHLTAFEVQTVASAGWKGITNGALLTLAEAQFDVFVTVDRNLSFQQHLPKFAIAVVLLSARSNRIADLLPVVSELIRALKSPNAGQSRRSASNNALDQCAAGGFARERAMLKFDIKCLRWASTVPRIAQRGR